MDEWFIDDMTCRDYLVVMDARVGIAELKSRLSHYLRAVRRGRTVTVLDRDRPVARLVPFTASTLVIRPRADAAARPGDVPPGAPLASGIDVVRLLLEERGER